MAEMYVIILGLVGYALIMGFECASRWGKGYLKSALAAAGFVIITYSTIVAAVDTPKLSILPVISYISWVPFIIFSALLVYSVFLEVPFKTTYTTSKGRKRLVTDGTYALVRHPGVLWYAPILASLILISKSVTLLMASFFWLAADIACVYLEEKVYLELLFGDEYRRYQKATPMLIPNRRSLARFLGSVREGWRASVGRRPPEADGPTA